MPEYLAPGVYVEEVSFRSRSIEGVSTTTAGFVGPTRFGPIDQLPTAVTSLSEFESIYGDGQQLTYDVGMMDNFLWHSARAFFEEGGRQLYCMRVFSPSSASDDGHARALLNIESGDDSLAIQSRFPGNAGNMRVRFTLRMGQNVLSGDPVRGNSGVVSQPVKFAPKVGSLLPNDIVWVSTAGHGAFYIAEHDFNGTTGKWSWRFHPATTTPATSAETQILELDNLNFTANPLASDVVRVVTLVITVTPSERNALARIWTDIPLSPNHERDDAPDSLTAVFAQMPLNLDAARTLPIVITVGKNIRTGLDVLDALFRAKSDLRTALESLTSNDAKIRAGSSEAARSVDVILTNGNDGKRPGAATYEGTAEENSTVKTGLMAFEDIDDISIIAAPGSTFAYETNPEVAENATTIINLLISHAERMRYRIAVIDSGNNQSIAAVRAMRGHIDSSYAALYYPWVRVLDPITRREINLPPSGFVAGIYARNDTTRAVYKAPANEVVRLAVGFETSLNKSQQDMLNPEGINCFRFFEGRGLRLWGARTASSDPQWKYVNLRRYFAYIERSLDKGTQWAVFEPNGEVLWANVRRTIEDFLLREWQMGALLGDTPEKAYFVRCDRSTMTQNDLDNGRLVCLIGIAPLSSAEFVVFRVGQWTANSIS